jgi:hypothetical protein
LSAPEPVRVSVWGELRGERKAPGVLRVLVADGHQLAEPGLIAAAWRMPEDRGPDSLEAHLRGLLDEFGLWGYHAGNPVMDRRGWPDWAIIGPRGMLFRELKTERGRLTPAQWSVGGQLIRAGQDWAVWRPRDLFSGVIRQQLEAIA